MTFIGDDINNDGKLKKTRDNKGIEIYQDIKKSIFPHIEIIVSQEQPEMTG